MCIYKKTKIKKIKEREWESKTLLWLKNGITSTQGIIWTHIYIYIYKIVTVCICTMHIHR